MSQYQQEKHEFYHGPYQQQNNHPPGTLTVYQRALLMMSSCGPPARLVPVFLVVYRLSILISVRITSNILVSVLPIPRTKVIQTTIEISSTLILLCIAVRSTTPEITVSPTPEMTVSLSLCTIWRRITLMVSIGSAIFIMPKVILLWFTSLERHFTSFIWRIWFITKILYMVSKRIYGTLKGFKLRARFPFSLTFILP